MRKRILHVIASLGGGGAESVLHNLWPSLCRAGQYEFEICVLNSLGHFGEKLVSEGAIIHNLGCPRKYDPGAVLSLRRLIQSRSYALVHAHLFPELYVAAFATAGLSGVRLVYTEHRSVNRRRNYGAIGRFLDKLAYDRFDQVISVNSSTEESLIAWQPQLVSRSLVIKNCVRVTAPRNGACGQQLRKELGLPLGGDLKLILFASRLHHQKGVDVLLKALAQLDRSDYFCALAGTGEERGKLVRMTASLGLQDRVRFLGFRSDVADLLSEADFVALPSRYEGLPLIVLEAMAAGCPIIATSVDGTAEVLRNEHSALLVPPDDPARLAEAINRFLDASALRGTLAEQAARDVEDYLADNVAQQLISVYGRVIGETPAFAAIA